MGWGRDGGGGSLTSDGRTQGPRGNIVHESVSSSDRCKDIQQKASLQKHNIQEENYPVKAQCEKSYIVNTIHDRDT